MRAVDRRRGCILIVYLSAPPEGVLKRTGELLGATEPKGAIDAGAA